MPFRGSRLVPRQVLPFYEKHDRRIPLPAVAVDEEDLQPHVLQYLYHALRPVQQNFR